MNFLEKGENNENEEENVQNWIEVEEQYGEENALGGNTEDEEEIVQNLGVEDKVNELEGKYFIIINLCFFFIFMFIILGVQCQNMDK